MKYDFTLINSENIKKRNSLTFLKKLDFLSFLFLYFG